jgi:hypothetical protein
MNISVYYVSLHIGRTFSRIKGTYIEGMLPDIDTDGGNVSEEWSLVRNGDNFKCLDRKMNV